MAKVAAAYPIYSMDESEHSHSDHASYRLFRSRPKTFRSLDRCTIATAPSPTRSTENFHGTSRYAPPKHSQRQGPKQEAPRTARI